MSFMWINDSYERNIPEAMWHWWKKWLYLPRCTVDLHIAQANRALSQVSTSFSIYTIFLQTTLEGCRKPEELFQAAGAVSEDLHTSITLTKDRYGDIFQGHTGVSHLQRAIPLSERPRTHPMLLARQLFLIQMAWWTKCGVDTTVERDWFEGKNVPRGAYMYFWKALPAPTVP